MFEKEGFSSWFKENTPKEGLSENTTFSRQFLIDAWDNGYSNGYNKANEWHNLKTEKPPLGKEVLWCIDNQLWLGQLCESWIDFGEWDIDSVLFNDYEIAWKEIVPPKESK